MGSIGPYDINPAQRSVGPSFYPLNKSMATDPLLLGRLNKSICQLELRFYLPCLSLYKSLFFSPQLTIILHKFSFIIFFIITFSHPFIKRDFLEK